MYSPNWLIGASASGKSKFGKLITGLLNDQGFLAELITSKQFLGKSVLDDAHGLVPDHRGWIETEDMILFNPDVADETNFQAAFKTGKNLNEAHEAMIYEAARRYKLYGHQVQLFVEIANGPFIDKGPGKEPIRQTGPQILQWMHEAKILKPSYGILVTVDPGLRADWNREREEGVIPDVPFNDTYTDDYNYHDFEGGLFGQGFTHVKNDFPTTDDYLHHMVVTFHRDIAKICGIEGFTLPPEYQDGGGNIERGRGW